MSEFQYYEFYSIDRALSKEEREEVDNLSSRFSPTSRRAVFSYSYSDFRHDEELVLIKYFDFLLYLANWGTRRVMYKLPEDLANLRELQKYDCLFDNYFADNGIKIYKKSGFVIVDIKFSEEEEDFWIEEDNQHLSSDLIGIRQDLLDGDYRALFIIWLHTKNLEYISDQIGPDTKIPQNIIPPDLDKFNHRLEALMELFGVDEDWVRAASKYSSSSNSRQKDYAEALRQFSSERKDHYLHEVLKGTPNLHIKLKQELERITGKEKSQQTGEISLAELLEAVTQANSSRIKREKEEAEIKRLEKLKEIEKNKDTIHKEIQYHLEKGSGRSYDEAMERIVFAI